MIWGGISIKFGKLPYIKNRQLIVISILRGYTDLPLS